MAMCYYTQHLTPAAATFSSASHNHLRAFAGQLESLGAAYDAQLLTQAEVDAIFDLLDRGDK